MKNKNILYIALIICLSIITYVLSLSDDSVTRSDRRDFSIADTSAVTKIVISTKTPRTATLERVSESEWKLNDNYRASKSSIFYLLKTLKRMEIAHPVPLTMRDNVIGNLAVKGIKVEVFLADGSNKTIYVGGENKELTATFMMLQNASEPYAVHIPGFKGYLSSRFFANEKLWRDKTVMNYDNLNISAIHAEYIKDNLHKESFHLDYSNSTPLSNWDGVQLEADSSAIQLYKSSFRKLYVEAYVSNEINTDSLLKAEPIIDLLVETNSNERTKLKLYHRKADAGTMVDGDAVMRDPERMYALINEQDWAIVQTRSYQKILKTLSDLKKQ